MSRMSQGESEVLSQHLKVKVGTLHKIHTNETCFVGSFTKERFILH